MAAEGFPFKKKLSATYVEHHHEILYLPKQFRNSILPGLHLTANQLINGQNVILEEDEVDDQGTYEIQLKKEGTRSGLQLQGSEWVRLLEDFGVCKGDFIELRNSGPRLNFWLSRPTLFCG